MIISIRKEIQSFRKKILKKDLTIHIEEAKSKKQSKNMEEDKNMENKFLFLSNKLHYASGIYLILILTTISEFLEIPHRVKMNLVEVVHKRTRDIFHKSQTGRVSVVLSDVWQGRRGSIH